MLGAHRSLFCHHPYSHKTDVWTDGQSDHTNNHHQCATWREEQREYDTVLVSCVFFLYLSLVLVLYLFHE